MASPDSPGARDPAPSARGSARAPLVFGWVFAAHQLGAAVAAYAAGVLRTELGTYTLAFTGAAWMSMLTAVMVLRIASSSSPRAGRRLLTPLAVQGHGD